MQKAEADTWSIIPLAVKHCQNGRNGVRSSIFDAAKTGENGVRSSIFDAGKTVLTGAPGMGSVKNGVTSSIFDAGKTVLTGAPGMGSDLRCKDSE